MIVGKTNKYWIALNQVPQTKMLPGNNRIILPTGGDYEQHKWGSVDLADKSVQIGWSLRDEIEIAMSQVDFVDLFERIDLKLGDDPLDRELDQMIDDWVFRIGYEYFNLEKVFLDSREWLENRVDLEWKKIRGTTCNAKLGHNIVCEVQDRLERLEETEEYKKRMEERQKIIEERIQQDDFKVDSIVQYWRLWNCRFAVPANLEEEIEWEQFNLWLKTDQAEEMHREWLNLPEEKKNEIWEKVLWPEEEGK
ncbi:hypothetical protein ACFL52_01620 [Candidatus Margulisiibacteriota bacterium]